MLAMKNNPNENDNILIFLGSPLDEWTFQHHIPRPFMVNR